MTMLAADPLCSGWGSIDDCGAGGSDHETEPDAEYRQLPGHHAETRVDRPGGAEKQERAGGQAEPDQHRRSIPGALRVPAPDVCSYAMLAVRALSTHPEATAARSRLPSIWLTNIGTSTIAMMRAAPMKKLIAAAADRFLPLNSAGSMRGSSALRWRRTNSAAKTTAGM